MFDASYIYPLSLIKTLRGTQYYLQLTADAHPEVAAMASARFGYVIPDPAEQQGARR